MPLFPQLTDGDFSALAEVPGRIKSYPFINAQIKDTTTVMYERSYEIDRDSYVPAAAFSTDPDDATAYLVDESKPVDVGGEVVHVVRTYCKIPGDQADGITRYFDRPSLNDIFSGSNYAASFDQGVTSHVFPTRYTGITLNPVDNLYLNTEAIRAVMGHVLITVQLDNSSQTFYTDDSSATIQNAMSMAWNGTTGAAANFYVARDTYNLAIYWKGLSVTCKSVTISDSSVSSNFQALSAPVVLGTAHATGPLTFTANQSAAASIRTLTVAGGHNGAAGDYAALWVNDRLYGIGRVLAVAGTSFSVGLDAAPGRDLVITHCQFAKNGARVVNGVKGCSGRRWSKFYLPGAPGQIATLGAMPVVDVALDPLGWLAKICNTVLTGATGTAATDKIGATGHGMATGDIFMPLFSAGFGGLVSGMKYYAIYVDANNIKGATSKDNAATGTAIDITSDGTGATLLVPQPYAAAAVHDLGSYKGPLVVFSYDELQMADAIQTRLPAA